MKLQFDPEQPHQLDALQAAIGVFEGQQVSSTTFAMPRRQGELGDDQYEKGVANRLTQITDDRILENIKKIQLENGIAPSESLNGYNFTIEMETGTGKTYVYLRSVFEMNKHYGFTKFIIVVPSIAIKEGVLKSLQMTEQHFKELYDNKPCDYFIYDSSKLEKVRNFASSDNIQIMVINIDAFRKSFSDPEKETSANIIHRWNDKMQGKPIDFIKQTRPVVIIDEPQSVDTTEKSAKAIKSLKPLCTFCYSATHIKKHNMLYKLNSIDAYQKKLVKQIEVSSIKVQDGHNKPYIKLLKVDNKNGFKAQVEIDIQQKFAIKRSKRWVKNGDDLMEVAKRPIYEGYIINEIYCKPGEEYIDFTSRDDVILLNQTIGDTGGDEYKRLQIRKTIEVHLDKELLLTDKGIKVLSLFFIDKVENYRGADGKGGKYAAMFEEEYKKLIKKPKYKTLFEGVDTDTLAEDVHEGYFSRDGKGGLKDTQGNSKDDESTYNLIMKDKEKLLDLENKLKFIFSHSALKEGWDNPNVFQICTLNETQSVIKKRQEIGRGMRICVNQEGERVHGFDTNVLTVMANESYEDFVKGLQEEIEQEERIQFGVVESHIFARIPVIQENGEVGHLGVPASQAIYDSLRENDYVAADGKITDALRQALKDDTVDIPEQYQEQKPDIVGLLKKVAGGLSIKNHDDKKTVRLNKAVFESPEFKKLWDKIKHKTVYRVEFDSDKLIEKCSERISKMLVPRTQFAEEKVKVEVSQAGVEAKDYKRATYVHDRRDYEIPDILTYLQSETNLKRASILKILRDSGRVKSFQDNPQKFIDEAKIIIKRQMAAFIVEGIKYTKIGGDHYYTQELFESEELIGYLNKNMMEAERSVYDHVVYDSDIEKSLAESFEANDEVVLYTKLPSWFKIETPLGPYNPDWAVVLDIEGQQRLYLVVESKGELLEGFLRSDEDNKVKCGEAHFKSLGEKYVRATKYDDIATKALSG